MRIFFCNVAWMKEYNGPEEDMSGGGSWVEANNSGNEQYNFRDFNGQYLGYVSTKAGKISIDRIGVGVGEDFADDVLVVWVAKDPDEGGSKIIGWYKNARVYRHYQNADWGRVYNITANVEDAVLLPIEERTKYVPRGKEAGPGRGMGQSNYWFADDPRAQSYKDEVKEYINNYNGEKLNRIKNHQSRNSNNKKSSKKELNETGFSLGDEVVIKDVSFPEHEWLEVEGGKGIVYKTSFSINNKLLILVQLNQETIDKLPEHYKATHSEYDKLYFQAKDLELVE